MITSIYDKLKVFYPKYSLWEVVNFNPVFVLWYLREVEHQIPQVEVYKLTQKAKEVLSKYTWYNFCN